jgi:hypothetical protein
VDIVPMGLLAGDEQAGRQQARVRRRLLGNAAASAAELGKAAASAAEMGNAAASAA